MPTNCWMESSLGTVRWIDSSEIDANHHGQLIRLPWDPDDPGHRQRITHVPKRIAMGAERRICRASTWLAAPHVPAIWISRTDTQQSIPFRLIERVLLASYGHRCQSSTLSVAMHTGWQPKLRASASINIAVEWARERAKKHAYGRGCRAVETAFEIACRCWKSRPAGSAEDQGCRPDYVTAWTGGSSSSFTEEMRQVALAPEHWAGPSQCRCNRRSIIN